MTLNAWMLDKRGSLVQLTTLQGSSIKDYGTTIFGTGLPFPNPTLHGAHFQTSPQILWLAWHGAPLSKSQLFTAHSKTSLSFHSPASFFFFGRGLPCSTSSASGIVFRRFSSSMSHSHHTQIRHGISPFDKDVSFRTVMWCVFFHSSFLSPCSLFFLPVQPLLFTPLVLRTSTASINSILCHAMTCIHLHLRKKVCPKNILQILLLKTLYQIICILRPFAPWLR